MYNIFKLKYLYQDLEPYIDTHTMGLHYNKHTKKYLDNLNRILRENDYNKKVSIERFINDIASFSSDVRSDLIFNLGGVLNHELYFNSMSPERVLSSGKFLDKVISKYGSVSNFFDEIVKMALKLKGSGYVFVILNKNNDIEIVNKSNQDSPLFDGNIPIFNIDMWEHAYYLNYKNNKEEYLDNFLEVADFSYANDIVK